MLSGWVAVITALLYLLALFGIAHYGDTRGRFLVEGRLRPTIYALTLAVYCTSWTFLGSVGLASRSGFDFLPIYIGPLLGIIIGLPLIARITHIAKSQRITSVADFIGSRYGKSEKVAAIVAMIAVLGTVPYIALQLKAISAALEIIVFQDRGALPWVPGVSIFGDISLFVALVLAAFAIAFGTRQIDATEHQNGLMLAVAAESLVKLLAFLAVGIFVVFGMYAGFEDLFARAAENARAAAMMAAAPDPWVWITTMLLAGFAIFLLPRQFHVMVVENRNLQDLRQAAWQFPVYLVLINIFVIPIALAGWISLPDLSVDRDFMVLLLPLKAGAGTIALLAFIGALSAATAMVIVESVACAIMISNDLVMPLLLRRTNRRRMDVRKTETEERNDAMIGGKPMMETVLTVRRIAVVAILLMGFGYYRASEQAALATIGLLSFAAIAQLVPAFFLGLFWPRANAQGASAGLLIGFFTWFYLLFLPTLGGEYSFVAHIMRDGPFGLSFLAPPNLMVPGIPPLVQGVVISLSLNTFCILLLSILREATPIDRLQASLFTKPEANAASPGFKLWRSAVSVEDLRMTVSRYLGEEHTERAFRAFEGQRGGAFLPGQEADAHTIRFAEQLLASAIGAASSRLVLSLMLRRRNVSTEAALKLLNDASAAIQYSRTLLQHGLDHARQGVTVFDQELRLMCWNRAFQELFDLPDDLVRFGVGLDQIISHNAARGLYGTSRSADVIAARITALVQEGEPQRLHLTPLGRVIEIRSNHLPDGGLVTTYTDITESVQAEKALEDANATLEKRVRARTEELLQVNAELARAKREADEANISKTRFLAAASHDIAQPLNAARLYASALADQASGTGQPELVELAELAENVEASLNAVEEILSALLEISRLDAGKMKAELSTFSMGEMLKQLQIEFEPVATAKGLALTVMPTTLHVRSDKRLLRRLLQNLISNAIKYTPKGRVLVGCRRRKGVVQFWVADTGIGIPASKQKVIFKEFHRLDEGARIERGLGLGLSIVERIIKLLGHPLDLSSEPGHGTLFRLDLPRAVEEAQHARNPAAIAPSPPPTPLNGLHVLVIDNEPSILDGMRRLLEGWGCTVITAASTKEALAPFKGKHKGPHLALVDYHLDETDGFTTIAALRKRFGAELPAVLITADRSPEVRNKAEQQGMFLLNKPIKPPALRALLTQLRLSMVEAAE